MAIKTDTELFNSDQDLAALLEQLLQDGHEVRSISSGAPAAGNGKPGYGQLAGDFAMGGFYNPNLYVNAYKKVFGGNKDRAKKNAFKQAVSDSNERSKAEHDEQIAAVQRAMQMQSLRNRVNQSFNSPQLQDVYNSIEKSLTDNALAGVTQQYSDLLKSQSFVTAGQGLTGSSVHAERLGDLQQGQNAAAVQAQGQARAYTDGLRNQNEQQRQRLVNTVSQQNPADAAKFNSQIDSIVNQTRQMGQQYANQAAGQQINQYGSQLQSQALGGLLSGGGNVYSGYSQGYNSTMQQNQLQNQQNGLMSYIQGLQ